MKVENSGITPLPPNMSEAAHNVDKTGRIGEQSLSVDATGSKDKAEFSNKARELVKARTAFDETPEVRNERVKQLKDQIETGAYEISYDNLALRLRSIIINKE
jgi:negative regulator of flagellin synthesis FlgM